MITEGQRSPKWIEGHGIRLRLHLVPFFGKMGLSEINAGTVQDYRVHRISGSVTGKPPARSTLHDEVGTLRQVLKTAIRHKWLTHLPDLSPPYKTQGKITHRPWFSPVEYKQLYEATRQNARSRRTRTSVGKPSSCMSSSCSWVTRACARMRPSSSSIAT
ncbi:hypothetical protein FBZ99_11922 [Rhizobium sp. ERR 1071]|uniref:Uncharacterized protein n=1 Tax=Rhizobium dioscoreae TaxID=2653122 RepID=A0ABQ0ZC31_9HYPH|nr:hypothetical protein FBZ99_11922 [Rhizobium sp. ERR1071]GES53058.1 hypothetical protein RsS93_56720 [Rhizobium dioscoreae]GLU84383.1 hypothetical protein Rhsp01_55590 [Rhizobium sp. NBRC 114257]